jgi:hypothetical protein
MMPTPSEALATLVAFYGTPEDGVSMSLEEYFILFRVPDEAQVRMVYFMEQMKSEWCWKRAIRDTLGLNEVRH